MAIRTQRSGVAAKAGLIVLLLAGVLITSSQAAARPKRAKRSKAAAAKHSTQKADLALRFMPDDCATIGEFNVSAFLESAVVGKLVEKEVTVELEASVEEHLGVALEEISRVTFGCPGWDESGDAGGQEDGESNADVAVVELNRPVDSAAVLKRLENAGPYAWSEKTVGKLTLHTLHVQQWDCPRAFCFPNEHTVVSGTAELLEAILKRNAPAKLPEKLAAARRELDRSQAISVAYLVDKKALRNDSPLLPDELLRGMEVIVVHIGTDSHVRFRCAVLCRDETIAYQLKGIFGAIHQLVKTQLLDDADLSDGASEIGESLECAVNGRSFVFQIAASANCFTTDADEGVAQLPGLSRIIGLTNGFPISVSSSFSSEADLPKPAVAAAPEDDDHAFSLGMGTDALQGNSFQPVPSGGNEAPVSFPAKSAYSQPAAYLAPDSTWAATSITPVEKPDLHELKDRHEALAEQVEAMRKQLTRLKLRCAELESRLEIRGPKRHARRAR